MSQSIKLHAIGPYYQGNEDPDAPRAYGVWRSKQEYYEDLRAVFKQAGRVLRVIEVKYRDMYNENRRVKSNTLLNEKEMEDSLTFYKCTDKALRSLGAAMDAAEEHRDEYLRRAQQVLREIANE